MVGTNIIGGDRHNRWGQTNTKPDLEWSIFHKKNPYGGWVGGRFFQEIIPLRGSILQAETCQILSLAENPRWSRVWQLERVQKIACRIILKDQYLSYKNALKTLKLENLSQRRTKLCKKFALNSLKYAKSKEMFPLDRGRNKNKYKVNFARHSRLLNSAIPQMQRLLNK